MGEMQAVSDEAWKKFLTPWRFENEFGVLEIPYDEIQMEGYLGSGKKGSTQKAIWDGKQVAVKSWKCTDYDDGPYSQWELSCYHHLKEIQGSLIPKLYFVSRCPSGRRVLGLEMGKPAWYCTTEEMNDLNNEIKKHGWMQRDGSWREDNVVYMKDENGSKRLVAIDLESFIPSFKTDLYSSTPIDKCPTFFGLPLVSPAEIKIDCFKKSFYWQVDDCVNDGCWGGKDVSLIPFDYGGKDLRKFLERSTMLASLQGRLLARPLFLTRERSGRILVGCDRFEPIFCSSICESERKALSEELLEAGWRVPNYMGYGAFGRARAEAGKKMIVLCGLHNLTPTEAVQKGDLVPFNNGSSEESVQAEPELGTSKSMNSGVNADAQHGAETVVKLVDPYSFPNSNDEKVKVEKAEAAVANDPSSSVSGTGVLKFADEPPEMEPVSDDSSSEDGSGSNQPISPDLERCVSCLNESAEK